MAAFRRVAALANRLNLWFAPRSELVGGQAATGGRARRCLAVGMCLAAGGTVAFYYCNNMLSERDRKRMGKHSINGRDLLHSLPAVEAKDKVCA